jgi:hypothetical protein
LAAVALLSQACDRSASGPSACDGISEKTLGITREDYSDCAGEIVAEMDALELYVERFVRQGDAEARPEGLSHERRLRHLMKQVGFQADVNREVGQGSDSIVQRWPDSGMRSFNAAVHVAFAQLSAALRYPEEGNLIEGSRQYQIARRAYAQFRL